MDPAQNCRGLKAARFAVMATALDAELGSVKAGRVWAPATIAAQTTTAMQILMA